MAKVLTAFDSDAPQTESEAEELAKVAPKYDFAQVFEALEHSKEVADNVFARCAKRAFRRLLADTVKLRMPEDELDFPCWTSHSSVTVDMSQSDAKSASEALRTLAESQAAMVEEIRGDKANLHLVGPLNTMVNQVGENLFTFSLKQKWTADG